MAKEVGVKKLPTFFDYALGAPICVPVALPTVAGGTDSVVVNIGLGLPDGMKFEVLGAGLIGSVITATSLLLGKSGDTDAYILSKTGIAGGNFWPCDGVSADPTTKNVLFDPSLGSGNNELVLTVSVSTGNWDGASAYVWLVPYAGPTDQTLT